MEYFCYLFVWVSCTILKNAHLIKNQTIIGFITDTAGGAVEEMLERVVEKIFPDGAFFFKGKIKARKKLYNELMDYIKKLKEADKNQIKSFFDDHYKSMPKKLKKKYNKIWDELGGDPVEFLKDLQTMDAREAEKRINTFKKVVQNAFSEIKDQMEDELDSALNVDIYDVVKELFEVKWDDVPPCMQDLFKLLHDQIYELKYLKLSSNDQDMVKIIGKMINDKNADLVQTLQPMFNYIEQVCEHHNGQSFDKIKLTEIAKADPFCYFRLECPNCKATGKNVYRDSENNVHCRCCNETFSIIQAVPDDKIQAMLEEVYNGLLAASSEKLDDVYQKLLKANTEKLDEVYQGLTEEQKKETKTIQNELHKLAGKIIGVEYFESFKQEIKDHNKNAIHTVESILKVSVDDRLKGIENSLREIQDKNSVSAEDMLGKIQSEINSLNDENKKLLTDIYGVTQQTYEIVNEIQTTLTVVAQQVDSVHKLRKALEFMNTVRLGSLNEVNYVIIKEAICPQCGLRVKFKRTSDENYYYCESCDYQVQKDSFGNISNMRPVLTVLEIKPGKERLNLAYVENNASLVVYINIDSKIVNALNDDRITLMDYNVRPRAGNPNPNKLIIRGDVTLDEEALQKLAKLYGGNIQDIIWGNDIYLNVANDWRPIWDGDVWNFDQDLHKLCRNTNRT